MSKKKYINADVLKSELKDLNESEKLCYMGVFNIINSQPIVDAEEVQHGKWINHSGGEWGCSSCANIVFTEGSWETPYHNYCPYCGAKMDKEKER